MKVITILLVCFVCAINAYTADPPKILTFKNGVKFDHDGHKGECVSCHEGEKGAQKIQDFGKEWAHRVCIGCHASMGAGPSECKNCHLK
ncbi:MAG: cytochrome c3 family protein [Desulfuromonadales bacterium]